MTPPEQYLSISQKDDFVLITLLEPNILEETAIHAIGSQIIDQVDAGPTPKIIIDFKQVAHLSSAALGQLITIHNRTREKEGQLRLCHIDAPIREVFAITKLDQLLHIHDTLDEAIKSFG